MTTRQNQENSNVSEMLAKGHVGFENLVNELPLGMLTCDREGNITAVNDFLLNILGSPSVEATKRFNVLIFPPLVEAGISAVVDEALTTGNETSIETFYRSAWGKELFLSFRAFPLRNENGLISGCHAIVEDFTEKRKTNAEIEKNKLKELLISNISDRFIHSNHKQIDEDVKRTLRDLAVFIGAERTVLYIASKDANFVVKTHEWCVDGLLPKMVLNGKWEINKLGLEALASMQIVNIPDVENLPEEGKSMQKLVQMLDSRSIAMVPLSHHGGFGGFISVESVKEKCNWKEKDLYALRVAGNMVANVLERKKTEDRLFKNEEILRLFIEHIPASLIMLDHELRHIALSRHWMDKYGFSDDIIGLSHHDVFPYLSEEHKDAHRRALKGEVVRKEEASIVMDDGSVEWAHWETRPWKTIDGTIGGIIIFIEHITERKKFEEKIIRSEAKYRSLFENSNDAIMIHDLNGRILEVNSRACEMFGYNEAELKQKSMADLTVEEDRKDIISRMDKIREEGYCRRENRMVRSDGSIIYVDVSASLLKTQEGFVQTVGRDITERVQAETAMLNAKVEAETANRTKSEFLATMSHELRTPLNAIIGFSEAMLGGIVGDVDSGNEQYLRHIFDNGNHLLTIINDILDISRIETGNIELFFENMDVGFAIREVVTLIESLGSKKGIVIDIDTAEKIPYVMADMLRFKQIMYNLVGNAIKFTDDKGKINIHAEVNDQMLRVSVIDTGIGISKNDLDKLFTPFSQVESSISRRYGGTGLGLAIVKELVELHNGSIWVESEPGKGSNFTFEIPVDQKTAKSKAHPFKYC